MLQMCRDPIKHKQHQGSLGQTFAIINNSNVYLSCLRYLLIIHSLVCLLFTSQSRIFSSCEDVTIAEEGLQNLDLCLAPKAFEQ